jgi:hypothetical protein
MTQVRLRLPNVSDETPPWVMPWNAEGLANESVRRSVELSSMAFQDRRDGTQGSDGLRRRRIILGLSLVGIFSMGLAALYGRFHWHQVKRSHPWISG